jgi:hypothetical protein
VAKILAKVVEEEQPGLVLCGKQAIDNDMNATGQMLSALLGWSPSHICLGSGYRRRQSRCDPRSGWRFADHQGENAQRYHR